MVDIEDNSIKMVDKSDEKKLVSKSDKKSKFIKDFTALKDHTIKQNDKTYEFVKGKKASDTNDEEIPLIYEETLKVEKVIK
jgi:hypothetical protein